MTISQVIFGFFFVFRWSQGFTLSPILFGKSFSLRAANEGKNDKRQTFSRIVSTTWSKDEKKRFFGGYEFGSITKGLLGKTASTIKGITGNDEYKFGDLTKTVVSKFTGNDDYHWGDITRELTSRGGSVISNFTGNEVYVVGDVSKEIIRRVKDGEYRIDDVVLLFKLLMRFGFGLSPVSGELPIKLLLEVMNYSLATEVGERMLEALATALDERFKEALTGDKGYKLGDLSKKAIMEFIEKTDGEYEFGDISKAISRKLANNDFKSFGGSESMHPKLLAELEMLDKVTPRVVS